MLVCQASAFQSLHFTSNIFLQLKTYISHTNCSVLKLCKNKIYEVALELCTEQPRRYRNVIFSNA